MRIEAAAWKGRAISFELFGPWRLPARLQQPRAQQTTGQSVGGWIFLVVTSILLVGALWLAVRNFRAGRGDTRGALRLAAYGLIFGSLALIMDAHHVPTLRELGHLISAIGVGVFIAAVVWMLYVALEPYVRRRWPQILISWTRLFEGNARDPLVAGHILAGTALGVARSLFSDLKSLVDWQSRGVLNVDPTTIKALDAAGLAGWLLWHMIVPVGISLAVFFSFFLVRLVIRSTWAAAAVYVALVGAFSLAAPDRLATLVLAVAVTSTGLWVMIRFGILPHTIMILVNFVANQAPLTSDLSAWYASKGLIVVALILALAVWSFRNALGGRKILQGDFLER
jgi:hypothetical protein